MGILEDEDDDEHEDDSSSLAPNITSRHSWLLECLTPEFR